MNPRIAFAFARGARVQYFWKLKWIAAGFVDKDIGYTWRIHPSDEHLQYGLLSTMLRNAALGLPVPEFVLLSDGIKLSLPLDPDEGALIDFTHWHMYELFMAEALADEGL